jgi:hypothetical protein
MKIKLLTDGEYITKPSLIGMCVNVDYFDEFKTAFISGSELNKICPEYFLENCTHPFYLDEYEIVNY